jgi:hypothetical protein
MEYKLEIKDLVKKYERILILQPLEKNICSEGYSSMITVITQMNNLGFKISVLANTRAYIAAARNTLHDLAVKNIDKTDMILWIDSDQQFNTDNVLKLIGTLDYYNYDVITGAYLKRTVDTHELCAYMKKEKNKYNALLDESEGILEIDGMGFGFVAMRPKVMIDLSKKFGYEIFSMPYIGNGEYLGEDFSCCEKIKELGYKIYVDTQNKIGHVGWVGMPR